MWPRDPTPPCFRGTVEHGRPAYAALHHRSGERAGGWFTTPFRGSEQVDCFGIRKARDSDVCHLRHTLMREEANLQRGAVPVPQDNGSAPTVPADQGLGPPVFVGGVGEQADRRSPQHLLLPIAEQLLGSLAPPGDDTAPSDGVRL